MDAISVLLFKPGFTILPLEAGVTPQYFAIDENLVWRSGISVLDAPNHSKTEFDHNRIALMRLMIVLLS